ncbi:DUF2486 family protein [Paraburkholderia saeva]|uniref:DUF2486 family protein n=1 Tax=Paraburkholderia saeva TaxID=2777537 RepID=UPI001D860491|nr:DUF2486 family protein [Paraburkholderia saeva]CAG4907531.1 hypothetical protein R52603_03531 [Paraburkholderia saeva]
MSHSSDSKDSPDEAIPLLTEVLATGSPTRSHHVPAPAAPVDTLDDVPVLEDVFEVPAPKATAPAHAHEADDDVPVLDDVFEVPPSKPAPHLHVPEEEPAVPADVESSTPIGHEPVAEAPAVSAPIRHAAHVQVEAAAPAAEAVKPVETVSAPFTMAAAAASTPSAPAHAPDPATLNPDALTEHLRGKFTAYLRGPGQEVIEERCRAAMQVHATWLVGQIAKEVGAVLEAQMSNWVREAVEAERKRQS